MVFVPPDRTERREAVSRLVAAAVVALAALLCLAITAFSGGGGPTRIAVVHKPIPAAASTPDTSTSAAAPPVRTFAQLRARFPLQAQARRTATTVATVTTWSANATVAATTRFYVRRLAALGVTWRPAATGAGARTQAGPVRAASGTRLARLTVRAAASGTITIVLAR